MNKAGSPNTNVRALLTISINCGSCSKHLEASGVKLPPNTLRYDIVQYLDVKFIPDFYLSKSNPAAEGKRQISEKPTLQSDQLSRDKIQQQSAYHLRAKNPHRRFSVSGESAGSEPWCSSPRSSPDRCSFQHPRAEL